MGFKVRGIEIDGVIVRPSLALFMKEMELKLQRRDVASGENDTLPPRGPWEDVPAEFIWEKLKEELEELLSALTADGGDDKLVRGEAVDVCLTAFFFFTNRHPLLSQYQRGWPVIADGRFAINCTHS